MDVKKFRDLIMQLRKTGNLKTLYNYEKEYNGDSFIHLGAKNHHKNGCLAVIIEELSQCPKDFAKLINKINFYGNTALMDAVL